MPEANPDLIVAISSAAGSAAIGVVRMSGNGALDALEGLVDRPVAAPRRTALRTLRDPRSGRPIDRSVVWWAPGPGTYTGEEMVEIHAHGNPLVLDGVVDACVRLGARPAEPGEFTRRALLNDKLDVAGVEAVLATVTATSVAGTQVAVRVLDGDLAQLVETMREQLLSLAATLEASIDYEEDVGDAVDASVVDRIVGIGRELDRLAGGIGHAGRLMAGVDVAIVGPVNVGKSTLLNRILGRERAIVHAEPGTTRDVVTGERELGGMRVRFHDTAGLREVDQPVEGEGIRRAEALHSSATCVLYVRDVTDLLQGAPRAGDVIVNNKVDLLVPGASQPEDGIPVSALEGQGIAELLAHLETVLRDSDDTAETLLWTARQGEAARGAARHLAAAEQQLRMKEYGPAATEIGDALRDLEELLGVDVSDAVLDELFARFCVGK